MKDKIAYLNLDSTRISVPHDKSIPTPVPPQNGLDAIDCSANENNSDEFVFANSTDSEYDATEDPTFFSKKQLYDQIRDLGLSKEKAELLASRLKEQNMVEKDVKVSYYRNKTQ